jgi:hypothetical protein
VPVLLGYHRKEVQFALLLAVENEKISRVYSILNPDKLKEFSNPDELQKRGIIFSLFYFFDIISITQLFLWYLKKKILKADITLKKADP